MRNAATYDDIGFEEPARHKPARKSRPRGKGKKKSPRFRVDIVKIGRYAALGLTGAAVVGIMVNALVMQKGHHPAPLFGNPVTVAEPAPSIPLPPVKPALDSAPSQTPAPPVAPKVDAPASPPKPHHDVAAKTTGDDPIARLLKSSTGGDTTEKVDSKMVFGVQQALVKLGYVLKPNGNLGPNTRKAIEMFEKDRHLPVNGDVSHRLVKILAAESGLKID